MIFKRGIWAGTVIRSLFCMQRADILQKEMMVMRFRSFALRTVLNRHCVMSEDAEDLIRLPERDIERIVMAMFVSMRQRLCISWKIILSHTDRGMRQICEESRFWGFISKDMSKTVQIRPFLTSKRFIWNQGLSVCQVVWRYLSRLAQGKCM